MSVLARDVVSFFTVGLFLTSMIAWADVLTALH
jgi:hypothetical protein